jgi:chaperonin GroES
MVNEGTDFIAFIDHMDGIGYTSSSKWSMSRRYSRLVPSSRGIHMAPKNATTVSVSPLADRVVVRSLEGNEQTRGGLFIPDTAKEKPQEGEILAVGPGRFEDGGRVPMDVKVGDKVLFGKYSGTEVVIDGESLLILRESDVLAVLS